MADESGWLIEAPWEKGPPSYLCVRDDGLGAYFHWTPSWNSGSEHMNALRFARKQDAERFVRALWRLQPDLLRGPEPYPEPRIVDHGWSAP